MDTTSYWMDSTALPGFPRLDRNLTVDVVVIGGGITGITAAYLLKKAGRSVALLERERCASIDTGHTTAHLTCVTDTRLHTQVKNFGRDHAKAVWEAGLAGIDQIYQNVQRAQIDCEFKWISGYLHAPLKKGKDPEVNLLKKDALLAAKLGFAVEFLDSVPFVKRPGIEFRNQAKFHPLKYLRSLVDAIPGTGSHVFEKTDAQEVLDKPLAVKGRGFKINCDYVVLATHNPLMGKTNMVGATLFQSKLALYSSYALGAKIPREVAPEASFWDTDKPYYYLRIDRRGDHDYAIFGGEDHKTGQETNTGKCYAALERVFRKLFPNGKIDHRWSGQVIETNDGLPLIGETAEKQFAATGFSGNGMTFGTLAGIMARDAVLGIRNPWQELFDVHRKKLKGGAWNYLRENADYPYYMLRDRLRKVEGGSVKTLKTGEGKIIKHNGEKVAAYRNEHGQVIIRSPVCTHMGCIVNWNAAEKTWECPCHGSRFKPTGEVIAGPAESPLVEISSAK